MTRQLLHSVLVLIVLDFTRSARLIDKRQVSKTSDARLWAKRFESWQGQLQRTLDPDGFNPKCKGYISHTPNDQDSQGLLILQHGFTACSNIWYLSAPRFKGWTIMAPTLPGHGRKPNVTCTYNEEQSGEQRQPTNCTVVDHTVDLPTTAKAYLNYTTELTEIVRLYKTENMHTNIVLVGQSVGGAVATKMGMDAPELFDRIMLLNPFLSPPTALGADYGLSFSRYIIPLVLPSFKLVRGGIISWGEACDRQRWPDSTGGHGGICQFTLHNFKAVFQFANVVERNARRHSAKLGVYSGGVIDRVWGFFSTIGSRSQLANETRQKLQVQLLTTVKDGSIANSRVHMIAEAMKQELGPNFGYCAMPQEFDHVYTAPIDNPHRDHWWLDSARVVGRDVLNLWDDFVSHGMFIPVSTDVVTDDKYIRGDPLCDIVQRLKRIHADESTNPSKRHRKH